MYVKYEGTTPFGFRENLDENGNCEGKTMQINCKNEYLEKAKEIDRFFIDAFYEHKWDLSDKVPISSIEGYDNHGQGGLWKRICKNPYKVNKNTKERVYLSYPPKMEFGLFYRGKHIETKFFTSEAEKLPSDSEIGPHCQVKFIAAWFSLSRGTFGLSLKPKLMQIMIKEFENIFDECQLYEDINIELHDPLTRLELNYLSPYPIPDR